MFRLPLKKCYFLSKICVLFMLVVTILSLFEHWRGGKRVARAQLADNLEEEYERQILEDEARIVPGLGDEGAAAYLSGEELRLGEESAKKYAMNTYLSDRISYNRTLKDFRNPACPRVVYDAELPSASVVIIFHNEPYSVVLRTVWSVLNTARRDQPWYRKANFVDREADRTMKIGYPGQEPDSEYVYLKEIILVDDNSTLPELRGKLSHYVRTRLPPGLVRLLRLPERQGLMRARSRGARAARGDVLVFLDAHCEAGADWLRPLLQRIRHKRNAVVTPVIDIVDQSTFQLEGAEFFQVGGFTFVGHFTWIDVPEREKKRRGSEISPTWSPTMAGGLFAMSRSYYWELGAYDEQMAGWGGENLEMSFRIWQCGGTLETIPCSRVGHVFRAFHPYGLPADSDTHGINTARMAEVWMDEYAELFYLHRPDLRKNPIIGDVTHRKILREKLHCKSFQWFLDNVYKEKFVPVRDVFAYGRVKNPQTGLCLDTMQREGEGTPLGLYPCHSLLSATQYLSLSLAGQLRDEEKCAELQYVRRITDESEEDKPLRVLMVTCDARQRGQKWNYLRASQQLRHVESGLCVDARGAASGADARARACADDPAQKWTFDYDDSRQSSKLLPSDMEEHLQKLKGQRRQSRSLLAEPEPRRARAQDRRRRRRPRAKRKNKKRGRKNKFILVVERTLMNNSEEHLELDVHCAHRRLLPNNTFVRDLVTILNEKNIRVINNGRVFERNRVSELGGLDPVSLRQEETKVLEKMTLPAEPPPPPAVARPSEPAIMPQRMGRRGLQDAYEGAGAGSDLFQTNTSPATIFSAELPKRKSHKKRNRHKTAPPSLFAETPAPAPAPPAARATPGDSGPGGAGGGGGVRSAGGAGTTPGAKRIIIEDFVEIKPSLPPPIKRSKKRKHKKTDTAAPRGLSRSALGGRGRAGAALGDSSSDDSYWSAGEAPLLGRQAAEPAPAQSRAGDSDSDDAAWSSKNEEMKNTTTSPHSLSMRFSDRETERSSETETQREREEGGGRQVARARDVRPAARGWQDEGKEKAKAPKIYPEVEIVDNKPGEEPGAVKLVMRSNLTFNLGDELFAWRRQPELANMLQNQLSLATRHPRAKDVSSDESSASDSSGSAQEPQ